LKQAVSRALALPVRGAARVTFHDLLPLPRQRYVLNPAPHKYHAPPPKEPPR